VERADKNVSKASDTVLEIHSLMIPSLTSVSRHSSQQDSLRHLMSSSVISIHIVPFFSFDMVITFS